jgi:hypothetical protein
MQVLREQGARKAPLWGGQQKAKQRLPKEDATLQQAMERPNVIL